MRGERRKQRKERRVCSMIGLFFLFIGSVHPNPPIPHTHTHPHTSHTYPHTSHTQTHSHSANILLDSHLIPKLSDFGLARECHRKPSQQSTYSTQSKVVMGTMAYMAPEFLRNRKLTPKTDVYSFGVVLLELYTGLAADDPSLEERRILVGKFVSNHTKLPPLPLSCSLPSYFSSSLFLFFLLPPSLFLSAHSTPSLNSLLFFLLPSPSSLPSLHSLLFSFLPSPLSSSLFFFLSLPSLLLPSPPSLFPPPPLSSLHSLSNPHHHHPFPSFPPPDSAASTPL